MADGQTVLLKPLEQKHSAKMFEWINTKELVEFNSYFKEVSLEDHNKWFERVRQDKSMSIFAIELANGEFIGTCQLHSIHPVYRNAELQIRIGEAQEHGKSYGTKACRLLLKHGFEDLNLKRIYLSVFEGNERAVRLYKKLGFKEEGLFREHCFINGKFVNLVMMGLLKNELVNE